MHFARMVGGAPKVRKQASPGQRPGNTGKNESALKGRHPLFRPFRAGFFFTLDPGRCPGLACLRAFGPHGGRLPKCMTGL